MTSTASSSASTHSLCLGLAAAAALCLALAAAAAAHRAWQQQAQQQPRDAKEAAALSFLQAHMPERDRGAVSDAVLLQHARLALAARRAHAWAADVPWQVRANAPACCVMPAAAPAARARNLQHTYAPVARLLRARSCS